MKGREVEGLAGFIGITSMVNDLVQLADAAAQLVYDPSTQHCIRGQGWDGPAKKPGPDLHAAIDGEQSIGLKLIRPQEESWLDLDHATQLLFASVSDSIEGGSSVLPRLIWLLRRQEVFTLLDPEQRQTPREAEH
jgi:hypothetical protein